MEARLTPDPDQVNSFNSLRTMLLPDWSVMARVRATAEARDLAELALQLHAAARRGTPCERAWQDALGTWSLAELSPQEVDLDPHLDGSCTLRHAAADALVTEVFADRLPPPLEWPIPPPAFPIQ